MSDHETPACYFHLQFSLSSPVPFSVKDILQFLFSFRSVITSMKLSTILASSFQLDCNPSQVKAKSNLRLVASLLLHSQWFSPSSPVNFNWPTSNAYISVNSQPIWVKLWILHLMTNLSKVYDTTPNLNNSKSQLISTTSNA